MQDRVPVNPGRVLIAPENGAAAYYATLTRADNPTQEGTPLNKATFLKDNTASLFGLNSNSVPDDVFSAIRSLIDNANNHANTKAKIEAGSYAGTGTSGANNPRKLTFSGKPKIVMVWIDYIKQAANSTNYQDSFIWSEGMTTIGIYSPSANDTMNVNFSSDDISLSWYHTNTSRPGSQLNASGTTYKWIAIVI